MTILHKNTKVEKFLFYSLILFLSTQLGKHFWPDFSLIQGIRIDYLSPTIYLTDILIGLIFVLWLFRSAKSFFIESGIKNQELWYRDKLFHPLIRNSLFIIPLLLFLLSNIFFSGRIAGGMYYLLKLLEMAFLAYYSAKFITTEGIFQKVIGLLGIGVIFQSFLAIAQYVRQGSVGGLFYLFGERFFAADTPGIANVSLNGELVLRPYGTFPHPNVLAGYLVISMTLVLYFLICHCEERSEEAISKNAWGLPRSLQSLAMTISLAIGTVALFLSMSRVAILLWVLIAIIYFFKLSFRAKSRNLFKFDIVEIRSLHALLLVGMTIGFLGFVLFPNSYGTRFTDINLADESIIQRSQLIESSVEMIKTSPLLGVGLGNFLPTLSEIQKPQLAGSYLQPVHNIFLLVAAETGLIGLGIFLWFIWKTLTRIKKQELRIKDPLLIAFFSILILGLFDHYWLTLQQGQLLFAFVIGLSFAKLKSDAPSSTA